MPVQENLLDLFLIPTDATVELPFETSGFRRCLEEFLNAVTVDALFSHTKARSSAS